MAEEIDSVGLMGRRTDEYGKLRVSWLDENKEGERGEGREGRDGRGGIMHTRRVERRDRQEDGESVAG